MVAGATGIDLVPDGRRRRRRRDAPDARARRGAARRSAWRRAWWRSRRPTSPTRRGRAAEAAELLPGAEIVPVSARTRRGARRRCARRSSGRRRGLPAARGAAAAAAARRPRVHDPRRRHGRHRHAVVGHGGARRRGAGAAAPGCDARVRGVAGPRRAGRARAGRPAGRAQPGGRGARRGRARRRDRAAPTARQARRSALAATYRVDVALTWATPDARPDGGARVAVHHGTRETAARLAELGGRFFQLRLEQPIVPARGDRLVIRALAPPDTLGGGVVLDPAPPRHGPWRDLLARLARLERGEPEPESPPPPSPSRRGRERRRSPRRARARGAAARRRPRAAARRRPRPRRSPRCAHHGRVVRLGRDMHVHPDALDEVRERSSSRLIERDGEITLAALRDELGTSRQYAQALLEHFDARAAHAAPRRRAGAQATANAVTSTAADGRRAVGRRHGVRRRLSTRASPRGGSARRRSAPARPARTCVRCCSSSRRVARVISPSRSIVAMTRCVDVGERVGVEVHVRPRRTAGRAPAARRALGSSSSGGSWPAARSRCSSSSARGVERRSLGGAGVGSGAGSGSGSASPRSSRASRARRSRRRAMARRVGVEHDAAAERVRRRQRADHEPVAGGGHERLLEPELEVAAAELDQPRGRLARAVVHGDPRAAVRPRVGRDPRQRDVDADRSRSNADGAWPLQVRDHVAPRDLVARDAREVQRHALARRRALDRRVVDLHAAHARRRARPAAPSRGRRARPCPTTACR